MLHRVNCWCLGWVFLCVLLSKRRGWNALRLISPQICPKRLVRIDLFYEIGEKEEKLTETRRAPPSFPFSPFPSPSALRPPRPSLWPPFHHLFFIYSVVICLVICILRFVSRRSSSRALPISHPHRLFLRNLFAWYQTAPLCNGGASDIVLRNQFTLIISLLVVYHRHKFLFKKPCSAFYICVN